MRREPEHSVKIAQFLLCSIYIRAEVYVVYVGRYGGVEQFVDSYLYRVVDFLYCELIIFILVKGEVFIVLGKFRW